MTFRNRSCCNGVFASSHSNMYLQKKTCLETNRHVLRTPRNEIRRYLHCTQIKKTHKQKLHTNKIKHTVDHMWIQSARVCACESTEKTFESHAAGGINARAERSLPLPACVACVSTTTTPTAQIHGKCVHAPACTQRARRAACTHL